MTGNRLQHRKAAYRSILNVEKTYQFQNKQLQLRLTTHIDGSWTDNKHLQNTNELVKYPEGNETNTIFDYDRQKSMLIHEKDKLRNWQRHGGHLSHVSLNTKFLPKYLTHSANNPVHYKLRPTEALTGWNSTQIRNLGKSMARHMTNLLSPKKRVSNEKKGLRKRVLVN